MMLSLACCIGWSLTPPVKEMGNYSMLERSESGIGGGIGEGDARVSIYVEVGDPQRYVDKATNAGARLIMPVTTITPTTTIAKTSAQQASSQPTMARRASVCARGATTSAGPAIVVI